MATPKKIEKQLKVHLDDPSRPHLVLCGKDQHFHKHTDQPAKTTCLSCRRKYDNNKPWYAKAKRKLTASKKK